MENVEIKKWHEKWWGIVFLIIISLIIVIFLFYLYQILYYLDNYKKGNLSIFSPEVLGPAYYQQNNQATTQILVATADDPFIGANDAKVIVVQFFNYHCSKCKEAFSIITQLISEYDDRVKFIFRDYPVEYVYPGSELSAQAGECADDQGKFLEYSNLVYQNQSDLSETVLKSIASSLDLDTTEFNSCLDEKKYYAEVLNDLQAGANLGVEGTPTYFISGVKVGGVIPYATFKKVLDEQLELAK